MIGALLKNAVHGVLDILDPPDDYGPQGPNTSPPCAYCDHDAETIHHGRYVCGIHANTDTTEVLL